MRGYILSIDQGTTGTTVCIVDQSLNVVGKYTQEFEQIYPQSGWVEHNPELIWASVLKAIHQVLIKSKVKGNEILAVGLTNQRETVVFWDKKTTSSLYNAIVWQCRRTADHCRQLKTEGVEPFIRKTTGLLLDPYFSASKIHWLLNHVEKIKQKVKKGEALCGTIDSYLTYKLSGGAKHITDVSNASRTLLMNLKGLNWDHELLNIFKVPEHILPEIVSSSGVHAYTKGLEHLPDGIPISGIAGDQQAALFGQACFKKGESKCTYGTGSFLLVNTGNEPIDSQHGMLSSVGWQIQGKVTFVLEGSIFIAGAAVQWIRDGLNLIQDASEIEALAKQVDDTDGVYFVPALTGLGAPHWSPNSRGVISGIHRGTTKSHLARATLEGIALQVFDLVKAIEKDLQYPIKVFKVDGGASVNNLLMQFQADILEKELYRPSVLDSTVMGASFLAGLAIGYWPNQAAIVKAWKEDQKFVPSMNSQARQQKIKEWNEAIQKVLRN